MKSSSSLSTVKLILVFIIFLLSDKTLARNKRWNARFGSNSHISGGSWKNKQSSNSDSDSSDSSDSKSSSEQKHNNDIQLSQCNDQSNCLKVETNIIKHTNEYEICIYWDNKNPKCNKQKPISSICNSKRTQSQINQWNYGISNKICKKVRCGEIATFGINDGNGCKLSSKLDISFGNIKAQCVYNGGYCAKCNKNDCSWNIYAPQCVIQSKSESKSQSSWSKSSNSHSNSNSDSNSKSKSKSSSKSNSNSKSSSSNGKWPTKQPTKWTTTNKPTKWTTTTKKPTTKKPTKSSNSHSNSNSDSKSKSKSKSSSKSNSKSNSTSKSSSNNGKWPTKQPTKWT
eukprot:547428_1